MSPTQPNKPLLSVSITNGSRCLSWVSRLCENSDVELARREFVSITLNKKRTALAVVVEGGKGRRQFCAFSARARFHAAWVIFRLGARSCEVRFTSMSRPRQLDRFRPKSAHVWTAPGWQEKSSRCRLG